MERGAVPLPRDQADLDAIRQECRAMVMRRAGLSAAAAALPIPAADIGVDVAIFLDLIPSIQRRFGLSVRQIEALDPKAKQLILLGATSIGSQLIGKAISSELVLQLLRSVGLRVATKSAARWLPIAGQAAAAALSFGVMRMVGNAHVEDCYRVAQRLLQAQEAGLVPAAPVVTVVPRQVPRLPSEPN